MTRWIFYKSCLLLFGVSYHSPSHTQTNVREWQKYGEVNKRTEKKYTRTQNNNHKEMERATPTERNVLRRTDFDMIQTFIMVLSSFF